MPIDDVDLAGREPLLGRLGLGGGDEARQPADLDREALEALLEGVEMLAGEEGGRRDQRDLHPRHRGDEGGAQRDLGLAEADIAADQPVHRLAGGEIVDHLADRAVLIVRLLIREAVDEGGVAGVRLGDRAGAQRPLGGDLDQLAGDLADALLHPRLAPLPGLAAQPVERHALALAAVAGEDVDILDRQIELVAAGIDQSDAIVRRALDRDLGQPLVAADAVIGMDDEIAGGQRRQLVEEGLARFLAAAADEAVAEHVLLGEQGDVGAGEAVIELDHGERDAGRAQRLLPAFGLGGLGQPVVGEQALQPLARARRVAGEHDLAALPALLGDMGDDRLVDVRALRPLRREIARRIDGEVEHRRAFRLVERRGAMDRPGGDEAVPFVARQIERLGRQRAVAARLLALRADAIVVIVGDALEPRLDRAVVARVADDQIVIAEMIEQSRQPLLEQGQPMIEAGDAAAVRHRLVERIAGRVGAEQFAIAAAEALDAVLVEQGLGGGQQGEAVDPVDAALAGRIEAADALDLVAEEIEPERLFLARRKEIDQPAAHRELAGIAHRLGPRIAVGGEQGRQPVAVDPLAGREPGDELADSERRQHPLQHRVDGGDRAVAACPPCAAARAASPAAPRCCAATARSGRRAGNPRPGRSASPAPARNNAPRRPAPASPPRPA